MKKIFLITTGLMFGLIAGLLFDILREIREVTTFEDILFRIVVMVLFAMYYFTGQTQ